MLPPIHQRLYSGFSVILFLLAGYSTIFTQPPSDPRFDHISIKNGLPGKYIHAVLQDNQGFIWIGSSYGLSRFDGYIIKNFRYDPNDSTVINNINTMFLDQNEGIWINTYADGLKYFNLKTEGFTHYRHEEGNSKSLSHNLGSVVIRDRAGTIWAGTVKGLNKLDSETSTFTRYKNIPQDSTSLHHDEINALFEDSKGRFWIGTGSGISIMDRKKGLFSRTISLRNGTLTRVPAGNSSVMCILEDANENFWIGTFGNGLIFWNSETNESTTFQNVPNTPNSISSNRLTSICQDGNSGLWIRTQDAGLSYLELATKNFTSIQHDPANPFSLSHNSANNPLTNILRDRENNLWTGSMFGLNRLISLPKVFTTYLHDPENNNSISHNEINAVLEDKNGILWIGTSKGLDRLDRQSGKVTRFIHNPDDPNSLSNNYVGAILEDQNQNLWIGSVNELNLLNPQTEKFTKYPINPTGQFSFNLDDNFIRQIHEDANGRLWLSANQGLYLFEKDTKVFTHYLYYDDQLDSTNLTALRFNNLLLDEFSEDQYGNLWLPYRFRGITRFNPATRQFHRFLFDAENPNSISTNYVAGTFVNSKGQLIVQTPLGIDILTLQPGSPPAFTVQKKIFDAAINNILEDEDGNLWLGSLQGLIKYNLETNQIRKFDITDGLANTAFKERAFKSKRTGEMFFCTNNGLLCFHPDSLKNNPYKPPVVITRLAYYDSKDKSGKAVEFENANYLKEITLPHHQNTLAIEFAALSFQKTPKNQYAYRIEGRNDNWIQLGTQRRLTLTGLSPESYDLRIKGSNGDGVWNEEGTALLINILPPWWWSTMAKITYLLLALALLYAFYRFQLNRRLAMAETERLRELDEVKTRLYTNITHEFRTPLTIIQGMADKIISEPKEWLSKGIKMIKRNSQNLLRLVNQMLDLSKLESGKMELNIVQGDVVSYLRYILESFHSLAEIKEIRLHFHSKQEELIMDYDSNSLLNITSNLLSNAVKFTPEGGDVYMSIDLAKSQKEESELVLDIRDTGIGIPEKQIPFIFDRFYQVDDSTTRKGEGTGIGLALTSELVKLLEGRIEINSKINKGTEFKVFLPISNKAPLISSPDPLIMEASTSIFLPAMDKEKEHRLMMSSNGEKPEALIVEDNEDVVQYLVACLEGDYQLEVAYNGQEGIDKALEITPDIIISDVMMPEKDGFELCHILKNDIRTSHIPIVLLTAKADVESKIKGLRQGADAYLAKPFNEEELQVRLQELLKLREKLFKKYSTANFLSTPIIAKFSETPLEDEFIQKVRQIIEDHLDDYDLDVSKMCREIGISRTPLHNKLKALTGKSTTEFIRFIRLNRAARLLQSTGKNVSEIAYETGFRNPNYFTKMFRELFGMSPSEYREH